MPVGRRRRFCLIFCFLSAVLCCSYLLTAFSASNKTAHYHFKYESQLNPANWIDLNLVNKLAHFTYENVSSNKNISKQKYSSKKYKRLKTKNKKTKGGSHMNSKVGLEEGVYLGGFRTDVDRTEDRKKKKRKEKFKKELKEKCLKEKEACEDLKELLKEEKKLKNEVYSTNSSEKEAHWSTYADKGFTIVGQQGSQLQRLPQVLIIGAKKAGTRALLEFLRLHPSVCAAGVELHFFDRFFYRGSSWYRSKLPLSLEGQLTVEKTPAYFVDRDVPKRVKEFLPFARLLLVVRDPVIRALSDYAQSISKRESRREFRDLVLKNYTTGLVNVAWGPIRGGLYARHYQRWRKYFPSSSIHVISGEGLVSDPAGEMAAVQDFLGLERVINDRHFYFNATKGFPCLVKREKNGRPHCLGYSKGRPHPKVDEEALNILRDFYRPFNAKFYRLVGRDFGWP